MTCKSLQHLSIAQMETDEKIVLRPDHYTTRIPIPFQQVSPLWVISTGVIIKLFIHTLFLMHHSYFKSTIFKPFVFGKEKVFKMKRKNTKKREILIQPILD